MDFLLISLVSVLLKGGGGSDDRHPRCYLTFHHFLYRATCSGSEMEEDPKCVDAVKAPFCAHAVAERHEKQNKEVWRQEAHAGQSTLSLTRGQSHHMLCCVSLSTMTRVETQPRL